MELPPLTRLVFGLAVPESITPRDAGLGSLLRWLGVKAGVEMVRFQVPSYDALARQMRDGTIQVAWLPPIVFVRLERDGIAVPLVTNRRKYEGPLGAGYQSVLLVRQNSRIHTLDGLRGANAAWVDPLSAAGYVLPRVHLAALGIDPRGLFAQERFLGSHEAAVRAVIDGDADVAATFAGLDASGAVVRGGWSDVEGCEQGLRVLATFGAIPADLIAVRTDAPVGLRETLADALVSACADATMSIIAKRVFGIESFGLEGFASYDGLRRAIDAAALSGLLEGTDSQGRLPTRPPGPPA